MEKLGFSKGRALAYGLGTAALHRAAVSIDKKKLPKAKQEELKKKHWAYRHPNLATLVAGGAGALFGGLTDVPKHIPGNYAHAGGEAAHARVKDLGTPPWLKGVSSKAEAKKVYRAEAMKHHPDRGGNAEKMKDINQQWDSFKKHHFGKLSMVLPSFFEELTEIHNASSR